MSPDYTQQLERIIRALESQQQLIPEWSIGLVGIVIGAVGTYLIEQGKERRQIATVERAMYTEILHNHTTLLEFGSRFPPTFGNPTEMALYLEERLQTSAWEYAKLQPHVLYAIKSYPRIQHVY